ncbi:PH domain-containing protein [Sediminibacillus massiliensis]|uniref:PH domain-containing protein n=1 Tax=Sediminibacillus massiliensis TaxID=1926277 RepID=UPI0009888E8A|nr:PH domain-containing protein [Sediminibacillus massiliensis]
MNDRKLKNNLSPSFTKIRIVSETIGNIVGFIVLGVLFWVDRFFAWPDWVFWVLVGLVGMAVCSTVWSIFESTYLYRSWSYQFDDEYLQLSYGIFKKQWVTVPMTKIQSVSISQGPIMKRYRTRAIQVETMGSSHAIPALEENVAYELRETLAEYAKLKEVDE